MAETILFTVAERILEKLGSAALQQIGLAAGVKRELEKLKETLAIIKAVLVDAEKKQTESHQLRVWLERLRDACYDADDVLDEFAYEALRQEVVARGGFKTKVHSFFSHSDVKFRFVMGYKIKEIRERLDEIATDRGKFGLTELDVDRHVMHREMTHSFVRPSDVIGRDVDKENIIKFLTDLDIDHNLSIIPIVGMGGLGKTSLAKLVYNDERVNACFQKKMWVCVSDDFVLEKLTIDIIKSATNENCNDLSLDQLQSRLRDTLRGKQFLLVLDDVWNDDLEKWNKLRELLLDNGVKGNKVIVTTRKLSVANIMGTIPGYKLQGLSDKECLSLFAKCAFEEGQEEQHPNLMKIGEETVRKCQGVPLAVRSLGSMLYKKTNVHEWLRIRDNEIWKLEFKKDDILPALRLSYKDLPSQLKKCFAFCSLFPKDYVYHNRELVRMWNGQGFLHCSNGNEDDEELGNRYINELLSRSFFQDVGDLFGPYFIFKMHDLVHDLALSVAQKECFLVNFPGHGSISNQVRHVSFGNRKLPTEDIERFVLGLNKLRTILSPIKGRCSYVFPVETCITRFKALQCLDLRNSSFEVLPSSISKLKNLRILILSHNSTIKELPNFLCKLLNLRHLLLNGCSNLKELPRDIGNLISLESLWFTANQMDLHLEKGIGQLTSLRELGISNCKHLSFWGKGIQRLTAIRTIVIEFCPLLVSFPCSLKYLLALETLAIRNCEKLNLMEWEDDTQDLRLTSLRYVYLSGLPRLKILPPWLCAANNLQHLMIEGCVNLIEIPSLQNLASLLKLGILHCPLLSDLPEGMHHLTSLRELVIDECPELSRRCKDEGGKEWHKIGRIREVTFDGKKIKSRGGQRSKGNSKRLQ